MDTVTLTMRDLLNGTIVTRTIDASNAIKSTQWDKRFDPNIQEENLNNWINERGNEQHDTLLELISWVFDDLDNEPTYATKARYGKLIEKEVAPDVIEVSCENNDLYLRDLIEHPERFVGYRE